MSTPASPDSLNHGHQQRRRTQGKSQRILACVQCQQRKIRCDRTFPCANCTKQNSRCVPATQTRTRRKRFPERELLDRLRRYETLLRDHKVKFDPMHKQDEHEGDGYGDDDGHMDEDSPTVPEKVEPPTPSGSSLHSETVTEARSIWQALSQESPACQGKDTPIANAMESSVKGAWDQLIEGDSILLGTHLNPVDLKTFHPDPVAAFKMWQLYLNNVDPLLKVTHAPTFQARLIAAIGNIGAVKPDFEALMFAVYTMAVLSVKEDVCMEVLGMEKEDLLTKFQFGCQQALMNAGYLRTSSRDCLTALMLYLMSIRPGTNPRTINALLGIAIRIAQCLGMHRESTLAKSTVFEAEMRRRLWWCLVLHDFRQGEKADHKDPVLAPTWDCRAPLNCNDSDLWPEMKEPPSPSRGRIAESLYIVVRCELADHIRHSSWYIDFTNPCLKPLARELPDNGNTETLRRRIEQEYLQHCDVDNPIQFFTINMTKSYTMRARLFEHFARVLNPNEEQSDAERDSGVEIALDYLDCDTILTNSPLCQGYLWYLASYFPFPAYMLTIQDLRRRPLAPFSERAWDVMYRNYQARFKAFFSAMAAHKKLVSPLFVMFSRTILTAWEALQKAAPDPASLQTPGIVTEILSRQLEAMSAGLQSSTSTFLDAPKTTSLESPAAATQNRGSSGLFTMDATHDSFMMADSMPYPSMVAHDAFAYDPNQFDWYLQQ